MSENFRRNKLTSKDVKTKTIKGRTSHYRGSRRKKDLLNSRKFGRIYNRDSEIIVERVFVVTMKMYHEDEIETRLAVESSRLNIRELIAKYKNYGITKR